MSDKIYVAGHNGMVGSSIVRALKKRGESQIITKEKSDLNLINQDEVGLFFKKYRPKFVYIAAAKVGGINANNKYRYDFIYENLMIQNNLINYALKFDVKKLLFLGSACIYPRNVYQPIKEESLLSGPLEPTNEPYSVAKIAGIKLCQSIFQQHNADFFSIMPNNLYGPYDNFDLETSHVLPALMRKIHEAKINTADHVEIWGSGTPLREFMHVDDLADSCIYAMNKINPKDIYADGVSHLNVGSGDEISIKGLASLLKKIIGYEGDFKFNSSYPDGMKRKIVNTDRMAKFGWKSKINLENGIRSLYKWYKLNAS